MSKAKRQQVRAEAENRLQRALLSFFRDQEKRIVAKIADGATAAPFTDHADDTGKLWDAMKKPLSKSIATGAAVELVETRKILPARAMAAKAAKKPKIPERLAAAVEAEIEAWGERDTWGQMAEGSDYMVTRIIETGLAAGWSESKILSEIRAVLAATAATRAAAIGTTMGTAATGAGVWFGLDELAAEIREATEAEAQAVEGAVAAEWTDRGLGMLWFTVGDDKVRDSHAALDGVRVARGEMFDVGGESAPYPGSYMLSPGEAYNCRCGIMGALLEEPE